MIFAPQFLIGYSRHLDMQVDSIEKRSAYFTEISLDDGSRAAAFPRRVTEKSTRTSVQVPVVQLNGGLNYPTRECRSEFRPSEITFVNIGVRTG